jgi:serine/threonine protein kinase
MDYLLISRVPSRLVHPNLVKLLGFSFRDPPAMILELINFGDLHGLIHDPSKEIDWHFRMKIILDMVKGMAFLHTCDPPIVHCDLKSPNVMARDQFFFSVQRFLFPIRLSDFPIFRFFLIFRFFWLTGVR